MTQSIETWKIDTTDDEDVPTNPRFFNPSSKLRTIPPLPSFPKHPDLFSPHGRLVKTASGKMAETRSDVSLVLDLASLRKKLFGVPGKEYRELSPHEIGEGLIPEDYPMAKLNSQLLPSKAVIQKKAQELQRKIARVRILFDEYKREYFRVQSAQSPADEEQKLAAEFAEFGVTPKVLGTLKSKERFELFQNQVHILEACGLTDLQSELAYIDHLLARVPGEFDVLFQRFLVLNRN